MARHVARPARPTPWETVVAWTVVSLLILLTVSSALALLRAASDDEVVAPDVVVVLGGGSGERVALGRVLAEQHEVPLVLSEGAILEGWRAGLACNERILCEMPDPQATRGEARMVAALADLHGWDRVAVTTSRFHVGRSRLLMRQCLDDVAVVGAERDVALPQHLWSYSREATATVAAVTVHRAC